MSTQTQSRKKRTNQRRTEEKTRTQTQSRKKRKNSYNESEDTSIFLPACLYLCACLLFSLFNSLPFLKYHETVLGHAVVWSCRDYPSLMKTVENHLGHYSYTFLVEAASSVPKRDPILLQFCFLDYQGSELSIAFILLFF